MEYQPADPFDPWTTGDLDFLLSFQEEDDEFHMEDLLKGSPYNNYGVGTGNFAQPAFAPPIDDDDAVLPYPAAGSTVAATGIICHNGLGPLQGSVAAAAAAALPFGNTAGAIAAPDLEDPHHQLLTVSSILSILLGVRDHWPRLTDQQKLEEYPVVVDLLANIDPWDSLSQHPVGFITKASNTKTRGGYWKERHFTAIRGCRPDPDTDTEQQLRPQPHYVGAQKTYEFHKHNGTKTKWLMHEYHLLDPHSDHQGLVLDEDGLVFRVVLTAPDEDEPGVSQEYQSPPKRRRSSAPNGESDVWQHYTKIYNKAGKLAYAACHDCDRIFGAQPKNGTSSLIRHNGKHLLRPRSS